MNTLIARVTRDLKVTYHNSVRSAQAKGNDGWLIDGPEALELRCDLSSLEMATLYNKLVPEENAVKRFSDRKAASKRLWEVLKKAGEEALANADKQTEPEKKEETSEAPKKKKAKKKDGEGGTTRNSGMDKKLYPVTDKNPYRESSKSHATFNMIMKKPGKTCREYAAEGGRLNTLRDAIRNQHVRCE